MGFKVLVVFIDQIERRVVLSKGQKWRPETKSSVSLISVYCSKERPWCDLCRHKWHTLIHFSERSRRVLSIRGGGLNSYWAFDALFAPQKWRFGGWGLSLCAIFFFAVAACLTTLKLRPGSKCTRQWRELEKTLLRRNVMSTVFYDRTNYYLLYF